MYGRLTVLQLDENRTNESKLKKKYRKYYICKCSCGNPELKSVERSKLVSGKTKSCGCLLRETTTNKNTTHNLSKTRFYEIWSGVKKRCLNKKSESYKNYGGRGITICPEWIDFLGFKNDMYASYLDSVDKYGEKETTLDRIDVNASYNKDNCRWVGYGVQNNNRRNNNYFCIGGETKTITEWARLYELDPKLVCARVSSGWTIEESLGIHEKRPSNGKYITINGEEKRLSEWLKIYNVDMYTYSNRIRCGWNMEEILGIEERVNNKNTYLCDGCFLTIKEISKKYNIPYSTIIGYKNKGFSIDDIIRKLNKELY